MIRSLLILISFLLFLYPISSSAQQTQPPHAHAESQQPAQQDTLTSDGLFQAARFAAFKENDYPKAIHYSHKGLTLSPNYSDFMIFLGRIYTWTGKLDSAEFYFRKAIATSPKYIDAYVGFADMLYWNDRNQEALDMCNLGLKSDPRSTDLLYRKAQVLYSLRDFEHASKLTDTLLAIDKDYAKARALASRIKDQVAINKVGADYDFVYFDKEFSNPWHLADIYYTRNTKMGSVTARVDYANRFQTNGLQYELESYPHISNLFYGYLNVGYSNDVGVFAHYRAGASLTANLPHAFEAEVGYRYLYFTSSTNIFTAYIGKYYKDFLFGARTYLTPDVNTISQSYSIFGRYYYGDADNYIALTLGTGISPDDQSLNYQLSSEYKLKTYKAGLNIWHSIKKLNLLTFDLSIINQEYLPHTAGNQMQAGLGYARRF